MLATTARLCAVLDLAERCSRVPRIRRRVRGEAGRRAVSAAGSRPGMGILGRVFGRLAGTAKRPLGATATAAIRVNERVRGVGGQPVDGTIAETSATVGAAISATIAS